VLDNNSMLNYFWAGNRLHYLQLNN